MASRMLSGSPILSGNNTIPGTKVHPEVQALIPRIHKECREYGLDYFTTIVEMMPYDSISELASYNGFPVRYPHWRFGMTYEEYSQGYEYGMHRISEMVINNDPCYIYVLDSNPLVDNIDVIAHAIGHNDFFKNNIFFSATNRKMMDKMADHGVRVRKYMRRWGRERVTEFIDEVLKIETLIDPSNAWKPRELKKFKALDERTFREPNRSRSDHNYMDNFLNPEPFIRKEKDRIKKEEVAEELDLFAGLDKDIFRYIKEHAPLKEWQQDVAGMLYDEAVYFYPQGETKMLNEGWASFIDFVIMCRGGLCGAGQKYDDGGMVQYAIHKAMVLGGKYSQNPYKMGFELFLDIEDRWNKGRFGAEYDQCTNMREKKNWDKKLGLGKEKVFEVRRCYNDAMAIQEFFTPEFCEKNQFYEYEQMPKGEWRIKSRDFASIKKKLVQQYTKRGLPDIRLADPNHLGKGWFLMQHNFTGSPLHEPYVPETMTALWKLWKNNVVLTTQDMEEKEIIYICDGPDPVRNVKTIERKDYNRKYFV